MEALEKAVAKARAQRLAGQSPRRGINGVGHAPDVPLSPIYTETAVIHYQPAAFESHKVVSGRADDPVADVYRALRARILQQLAKAEKSTIGITSAREGEGKSLTAVNLAISIAMDVNQTVMLVDLDLRNPSVHRYFGIEPKLGVSDHLMGRASVAQCLINPGIERLVLLPAVGAVENSAELLSSPQMARLAVELKQRFTDRIIIYDLPSLLTVGDTIGFLPNVEATILVMREGGTRRADLARAIELLHDHNLICTVLNASS